MPNRSGGVRKTTTQKGLGHDHQENRRRLLTRHTDGRPCWWCGKPMFKQADRNWDGHALEADHTKSRSQHGNSRADRLLHKTCNIQRGDGTHDDQRPTLIAAVQQTPTTTTDLGALALPWPDTWTTEATT
ncbi:HNH endonuclease [Mycobacterium phage Gancho]|uniref:HNH endonuclease n=1 Tax=Mycobacterium phage Gancho TaxID=2301613 RepID=A0A385UHR9_9CAUD|nr:HNH endonuclease [Mycobacterium phage Gancho]